MINFILWKWRARPGSAHYMANHVNAMVRQLCRHYNGDARIICVTDDAKDIDCETFPLWKDLSNIHNVSGQHLPSCYRRLKIFDKATQNAMGIAEGDRICSIDLDAVIVSNINALVDRADRFVGWHVPGTRHATVYNGSMFLFQAGDLDFIWHEFDPQKSPLKTVFAGYMGSDQGWLSYRLIKEDYAKGWTAEKDGVLSFTRNVAHRWPGKFPQIDPNKARIVFFAGRRKPWHQEVLKLNPWITQHVDAREEQAA